MKEKTLYSIKETSDIILQLLNEYITQESGRTNTFKDTIEVILTQLEYYFAEIVKFSRFQSENILKQEEKSFTIDVEKEAEFLIKSDYDLALILGEDTLNQLSRFQEVKVKEYLIYYFNWYSY